MMRATLILTLLASVGLLAACETVKGVGKDLQNSSEAVQRQF
jgi:predicted small secreted protein